MGMICVRVRIFGLGLWALICLGFLNRGAGPKAMVPTDVWSDIEASLL